MRGDQPVQQWWVNWGIEASSNGLTIAEIARPDRARMEEKPFKSLFQKLGWAFLFLKGVKANILFDLFLKADPDRRGE